MEGSGTRKGIAFVAAVFIICFFASAVHAGVVSPELKVFLQTTEERDEVPVIINFSGKADPNAVAEKERGVRRSKILRAFREKADLHRGPLQAFLLDAGGKNVSSLWIINGLAAKVPAVAISAVANFAGVESVGLDYTLAAPGVAYGTTVVPEWNIAAVKAPDLWSLGYTGTGVVVANMDTGVDMDHPDLQSRWRGGTNSWYDPNGEHAVPYDANGHGTQTMGIMVGGSAGGTSIGVAPGAKWIAVKIYNDADLTTLSTIHRAFQWVLDPDDNPDTDDAPDVVNNSWGLDGVNGCSLEFEPDIQALRAANIAVSFSAGNNGPYSPTSISPANNVGSFAVGATDSLNRIASFSGLGPSACDGSTYPQVVAPGVNVRTSDLTYGGVFTDSYAIVTGTSFASPHVAGTMALLLNAYPEVRLQDLELAIKTSALDLGTLGADDKFGYGLIDGMAALRYLASLDGGSPPVAVNDSYTVVGNSNSTIAAPGVLGNDSSPNGYPLSSVLVSGPTKGLLSLGVDGSFTYKSTLQASGMDAFTYKVYDGHQYSNVATVTITVNVPNLPPVAANDVATTPVNVGVSINVAANDHDPDGTIVPASVLIVTPATHGIATVGAPGIVKYTPLVSFKGTDTFRYTIKDNKGAVSNVATVTIAVNAPNLPPVAGNDVATTPMNLGVSIDVAANDHDPDGTIVPASVLIVTPATHGIATVGAPGTVQYTPFVNFSGTDTFRYTIKDNKGAVSNMATVTITVSGPDLPPVAVNDVATTPMNVGVSINVAANDHDPDGTIVSASLLIVTPPAKGVATVGALGVVKYAPQKDFKGTDSFRYTIKDNKGAVSNVATVTVTVNGPNLPPVAVNDVATTPMNLGVSIDVAVNDHDPDGTIVPASVLVVGRPAKGVAVAGALGTVKYTPLMNFSGTDSFRYTIKDDKGAVSNVATVTITVNGPALSLVK